MRGNHPGHLLRSENGKLGLSPRMRGNQSARPRTTSARVGSIPAHAGEPSMPGVPGPVTIEQGLSPRMRGNPPDRAARTTSSTEGLSPRMRGNPVPCLRPSSPDPRGSIPAHAGEPRPDSREVAPRSNRRVYPRACGGTCQRLACKPFTIRSGSIPAHAGEPGAVAGSARTMSGSIPAHAGEPRFHTRPAAGRHRWVYPRACGGTDSR